MKKIKKTLLVVLLTFSLSLSVMGAGFAEEEVSRKIHENTGRYFLTLIEDFPLQVGSTGGEWIVIGLSRSDLMTEAIKENYYETAANFVEENANAKEQLHRAKSTENSRLILALTAIGKDVTDVRGHNLLKGLADLDYLNQQGINGPIWALLALDSAQYEIPETDEGGNQASRENIIQTILENQQKSGWWALSGIGADPDITGMAIQALSPYYSTHADVKSAVDAALTVLSDSQTEDGNFVSTGFFGGSSNLESVAQVLVALTSLGINPRTDSRFLKNGHSVVDALCSYATEGGGFCHVAGGGRDGMASEQGYYALTAYLRFLDGKTHLYDMSDLKTPNKPSETETTEKPTENSELSSELSTESTTATSTENETNRPLPGETKEEKSSHTEKNEIIPGETETNEKKTNENEVMGTVPEESKKPNEKPTENSNSVEKPSESEIPGTVFSTMENIEVRPTKAPENLPCENKTTEQKDISESMTQKEKTEKADSSGSPSSAKSVPVETINSSTTTPMQDIPQTGDDSHFQFFLFLLLLTLIGLSPMIASKKKGMNLKKKV